MVLEGLQIVEIIPHAVLVEVRKNEKFDELSNEIDIVVDAEFSSDDVLSAFKACPLSQQSIECVRPNRDFDLSPTRVLRIRYSTVIHTGQ